MKKIFCILIVVVFLFMGISIYKNSLSIKVNSFNVDIFARVNSNATYLYKTPTKSNDISNRLFLLEQTYYVRVLEQVNDDFFQVQYLDICGYVFVDDLTLVKETPACPYLDGITFDISPSINHCTIRTEPNSFDDSNIVTTLSSPVKNLSYYGKIAGSESVTTLGNLWYYCSLTHNDKEIKGYVYAPYVTNLSPIIPNEEILTSTSIEVINATNGLLNLNITTENIIIFLVALPTIAVLYLLLRPSKSINTE